MVKKSVYIPGNADLNDYTTPGMYSNGTDAYTVRNTPVITASFSLLVQFTGAWGRGVTQIFTDYINGNTYTRTSFIAEGGAWLLWRLQAVAEPSAKHALPVMNDYVPVPDVNSYFSKNQFGEVHIVFRLMRADKAVFTHGAWPIAVLPNGYRPISESYGSAHVHSGISAYPCSLSMHPADGVLYAHIHYAQMEDILIGNIIYNA